MAKAPDIVVLPAAKIEELLCELRALLPAPTYQLVESLLRTLQWLMFVIEEKKSSIARLKRMIFGHKTEKADKILKPAEATSTSNGTSGAPQGKRERKGHGRKGAKNYRGATRVSVPHPQLKPGDPCPKCLKGKLYLFSAPAQIVRVTAQPPISAKIFELQRLRCCPCGALFTAPAPAEAGTEKFDSSVGTMLPIMRYGTGLPMYRTDKWQNIFGVPLPASTQWELIDAASKTPELVYDTLIDQAAQGRLMHSDDTTMRVQSLKKEISQAEDKDKRTGIFTTSIVSLVGEHRVALFFTGRKHAGENLDLLLKRRAPGLEKPLQMSDALACNIPKEFETILCNCIPHARRNFVDVLESFPEECRKVIENLRQVYQFEAATSEAKLSDLDRLAFHQQHSQPVMAELHQWMKDLIDQKKVEPNSGLGQAIRYMLKHWQPLTRFLHVPGAPLDNNLCERALKTAILHRKNSMSYKTVRGAEVGDIYMSVIHTCQLNGVNPFDYLMALQRNAAEVKKDPTAWLPWNYPQALAALNTS